MYVSQQYQLMMQKTRDIQHKQIEQNHMMMQKAHQYKQPLPAGFVPSTNNVNVNQIRPPQNW